MNFELNSSFPKFDEIKLYKTCSNIQNIDNIFVLGLLMSITGLIMFLSWFYYRTERE